MTDTDRRRIAGLMVFASGLATIGLFAAGHFTVGCVVAIACLAWYVAFLWASR